MRGRGADLELAHFYHAYAAGEWLQPVSEHLEALTGSEYPGTVQLGLVGLPAQRRRVLNAFDQVDARIVAENAGGWEQLTLHAISDYAAQNDGAVLYAHTKGAATLVPCQEPWRQAMTQVLVYFWRDVLRELEEDGFDAAGPHWITQAAYPERRVPKPCFAGNFWMATCEYLRSLPKCSETSRWEAEVWIGMNNPKVVDLFPGWPNTQGLASWER